MFIHHIFTFPDRAPSGMLQYTFSQDTEILLGWIGKYCVSIFLFISGYGYSVSKQNNSSYYWSKILATYRTVWIVFFIFIPLDVYFLPDKIALNTKDFILNLFGLSSSYNGEWWFLILYILLVAITPLLQLVRNKAISIVAISIILHNLSAEGIWKEVIIWQSSYMIGFLFGIYSSYKKIHFTKNIFSKVVISILFSYIIFKGFIYFWLESIVFLAPLAIYILLTFYEITNRFLHKAFNKIIIELGDKSIYMWLVHSFFAYHFMAKFIYAPRYSILVLLNLLIISYITALLLSKLEKFIILRFSWLKQTVI
ncbi:acyltransferase family protein [Avibacterium sp. 21-586]|nr:acyltransferase family protein [Avibacterium sp. 21-586]